MTGIGQDAVLAQGFARYDVLTPVPSESRAEPFWLFLGEAIAIRRGDEGPIRIRVKLDVLPHQGEVLRFGPGEGEFDLVLDPGELEDTVRLLRKPVGDR